MERLHDAGVTTALGERHKDTAADLDLRLQSIRHLVSERGVEGQRQDYVGIECHRNGLFEEINGLEHPTVRMLAEILELACAGLVGQVPIVTG